MTKWMKETQGTTTTDMMKEVLSGKQHPQIYKGIRKLQGETLHNRTNAVLATRPGPAGPMSRLAGIAPEDTHPRSELEYLLYHLIDAAPGDDTVCYSTLGFGSGVGTIDALATIKCMVAPMTALRRGYKSCSATIFLDLEKAFELVSKEVLLDSAALLGIRGQFLIWLDDYLTNRTGIVQFHGKSTI